MMTSVHKLGSDQTLSKKMKESAKTPSSLHTSRFLRRTHFNRVFAVIYTFAFFSLLYRHALTLLLYSPTFSSKFISLLILLADVLLGFMWITTQSFRMRPMIRQVFPQNLKNIISRKDFPAIDIFICTADPFKEPPIDVVNTALSVMAYDYPPEKISVYVSDDGGSELTLFAFMEAAKFARDWLPFCRKNSVLERCPDVFFRSNYQECSETEEIKMMYETMMMRVEKVVERGKVIISDANEQERKAFDKWSKGFTRQNHPTVIQVLLESGKHEDISGNSMPNLIYVSRQKSTTSPHHFKAGALNALLRVSAIMTNAPIILTLDCDMYSNDPETLHRVLCYFCDPSLKPDLGYIQFPQRFHGLNKADIYGSEYKRLFITNPIGMDGFAGPSYVGTGCFFRRRVFFGDPSSLVSTEIADLSPTHVVEKAITGQPVLALAHHVAGCNYEEQTTWGSNLGFKYGSLVEDYYTGYRLQCEGWKSVFCQPDRPAFLGDIPINLNDILSQTKRWSVGLLEVALSKYSPLTFGVSSIGPIMGFCYAHYAFWPIWSVPITIYAFLPQLALLNKVSIFPKVMTTDPWFYVYYVFLFLGAYGQHCLDFILEGGTFQRWWSDQRIWLARGLTSYLFGSIEYVSQHLGIPSQGFNVTSKVLDDEQSKRYDQGKFEFGVASPMFVPLASAAIINLVAFLAGIIEVFKGGNMDGSLFVQMLIAGYGVLNCLPIYEAVILRSDKGRMPTKITIISTFVAVALYITTVFIFDNKYIYIYIATS